MREQASHHFRNLQHSICQALEALDTGSSFGTDEWTRPDTTGGYGGGGLTRVISNGTVFEKGAVNFSEVEGKLPADMSAKLADYQGNAPFYATGISLILHPRSPMVPTTHANFRYLEVADKKWFGGGSDLTPYYLFEDDAVHFHQCIKTACDKHDKSYYPRFKKECDEYFFLPHRCETRGIGGFFFDYLGRGTPEQLAQIYAFVVDASASFVESYVPIVKKRKDLAYTEAQKDFQLIRRGRYVEFNLLYDRGTHFGLKTAGRAESILVSMPPEVRWSYQFEPIPGSPEEELIEVLRTPREWVY